MIRLEAKEQKIMRLASPPGYPAMADWRPAHRPDSEPRTRIPSSLGKPSSEAIFQTEGSPDQLRMGVVLTTDRTGNIDRGKELVMRDV